MREATVDDYEEVLRLFREVEELHRRALPGHFGSAPSRTRERLREYLKSDDATIVLAESYGEVAGLVQVEAVRVPRRGPAKPVALASIVKLVVGEGHRREGVGQALMEAVSEWARGRGLREVELDVYEFNEPAIRFYESIGYETVRRKMRKEVGG